MSLNENNKQPWALWNEYRNKIVSYKGGWRIGDAVYNHGFNMMEDFIGKKSFFQVLVLNTTGKMPSKEFSDWLEASFICLSWPDARIWCNQIGALAGTLRTSCASAVAGGILAADSRMYGAGTMQACLDFIIRARKRFLLILEREKTLFINIKARKIAFY